eukprot:403336811
MQHSQVRKKPDEELQDLSGEVIGKRYKLKKQAGQGAHGMVYLGKDTQTDMHIAVKVMAKSKKHKVKFQREVQIMKDIMKDSQLQNHESSYNAKNSKPTSAIGFPQLFHYELTKDCFALVMERLGPSLKDIRDQISKRFSLKNTIMIAIQLVKRLKTMHDLGYVHRDLKPANIMMGQGKKENIVYLIDFGLTKKVGQISMGYTSQGQISRKMAGTPIYSSINAHLATGEYFKKDDLESMMYVIVQISKGVLPWQSTRAQNQEDYRELMLQKASIPPSLLCKDLPIEFTKILEYILNIENGNEVDYSYIDFLFNKAADKNNIKLDGDTQNMSKNALKAVSNLENEFHPNFHMNNEMQKNDKLNFTFKDKAQSSNVLMFPYNNTSHSNFNSIKLDKNLNELQGNKSQIVQIDECSHQEGAQQKQDGYQFPSPSDENTQNQINNLAQNKDEQFATSKIHQKRKASNHKKRKAPRKKSKCKNDDQKHEDLNNCQSTVSNQQFSQKIEKHEENKAQESYEQKHLDQQQSLSKERTQQTTCLTNMFSANDSNQPSFSYQDLQNQNQNSLKQEKIDYQIPAKATQQKNKYVIDVIQEDVNGELLVSSNSLLYQSQFKFNKPHSNNHENKIDSQLRQIEIALGEAGIIHQKENICQNFQSNDDIVFLKNSNNKIQIDEDILDKSLNETDTYRDFMHNLQRLDEMQAQPFDKANFTSEQLCSNQNSSKNSRNQEQVGFQRDYLNNSIRLVPIFQNKSNNIKNLQTS